MLFEVAIAAKIEDQRCVALLCSHSGGILLSSGNNVSNTNMSKLESRKKSLTVISSYYS